MLFGRKHVVRKRNKIHKLHFTDTGRKPIYGKCQA